MKIAVITPYFRETTETLAFCHASVMAQSAPCTMIAVADGHPNPFFDTAERCLHIKLPAANGDYGDTPRALGGLFAAAQGFDAVAYLDADNWLEPDHLASMLEVRRKTRAAMVACKRQFFTPDRQLLLSAEDMEDMHMHVDTSCWLIFREAYAMLPVWAMPKVLAPVGDRLFFQKAQHDRWPIGFSNHRTVCYVSRSPQHYEAAGLAPPKDGKSSTIYGEVGRFLLSEDGARTVVGAMGFYPSVNW